MRDDTVFVSIGGCKGRSVEFGVVSRQLQVEVVVSRGPDSKKLALLAEEQGKFILL